MAVACPKTRREYRAERDFGQGLLSFGLFSPCSQFVCLIILWQWWVVVAARRLFLVAGSGATSSSRCLGFSWWRLLLWAPWLVGSSWSRTGTPLPCTGRRLPTTGPLGKPPSFYTG